MFLVPLSPMLRIVCLGGVFKEVKRVFEIV